MRVRFWGVRGSIPVPGPGTVDFGGNTACLEVRSPTGQLVIIDGGTGLRCLGDKLMAEPSFSSGRGRATFLFSHTHWDHIQGFPFFCPLFQKDGGVGVNRFTLYGPADLDTTLETVLRQQMNAPFFPVDLDYLNADLTFHDLQSGQAIVEGEFRIEVCALHHPGGCLGFALTHLPTGKRLVYASDTEPLAPGRFPPELVELARGADLLVHDAHFTPAEYPRHVGWGHSTWEDALDVAQRSEVARLLLFHHAPSRSDDELRRIEREVQSRFPRAEMAREGRLIEL